MWKRENLQQKGTLMLNIRIICVGKFKEKYWEAASAEYMKRLGAYCSISVTEVKEEKLPAHASRADEENVITKEGKSILDRIGPGDYVIALDIGGRELSSEDLAAKIAEISFTSSTIDFIIGGSLGLSREVKSRAALKLSFGRITLPHQLARIVLLEQIYRAFKINAGETYHK
jgi:23S rRNA (pseudouridine1915-N3)-methyltransferase